MPGVQPGGARKGEKGVKIDTTLLRSMSVAPDEVEALELAPGENIRCKGKTYYWDVPVVLIVDRLKRGRDCWDTTMIRQVLECPYSDWGQDYSAPDRLARQWAKAHNMPLVTVPGGVPPLTIEGTVAIPDFAMSGTSWYIIPECTAAAFDLDIKRLGAG